MLHSLTPAAARTNLSRLSGGTLTDEDHNGRATSEGTARYRDTIRRRAAEITFVSNKISGVIIGIGTYLGVGTKRPIGVMRKQLRAPSSWARTSLTPPPTTVSSAASAPSARRSGR